MRYCGNCGKEISEDVKFCPYCGAKVEPVQGVKEKASSTQINSTPVKKYDNAPKRMKKSGKQGTKHIIRLVVVALIVVIVASIIHRLYESHQEQWLVDVASYFWVEELEDGSTDIENDDFSYLNFQDDGKAFGMYESYSADSEHFKCEPDREYQKFSIDNPGKFYKEITLDGDISDIGHCTMLAYPADGSRVVTYRPYSKHAYGNLFDEFP